MNIENICPTCKKSISATPLVDILVTYQEDLTGEEIYEQGWHKQCYPHAPALLALLTERVPGLSLPNPEADFANDLQEIAGIIEIGGFLSTAAGLRAKAQAIRAAIAEARGE